MKWTLDIYQVIDGTDNWPLVRRIEADTPEMCIEIAGVEYPGDDMHWTNPYEA